MPRDEFPKAIVSHVTDCLTFFRKAVPNPISKNIHTQIGCHFEEVVEMIEEIEGLDDETITILRNAQVSLHRLANHLKKRDGVIVVRETHRVDMLDALCDQMVTAIGVAHMLHMDIDGGFNETNQSNLSKFGDDGEPIFDENKKVTKGPNYRKSDLTTFV